MKSVVSLPLVVGILALAAVTGSPGDHQLALPLVEIHASTPREFGRRMGAAAKTLIARRFAQCEELHDLLRAVHTSAEGKAVYGAFFRNASAAFPQYMEEIRGIAEGAGRTVEEIFVMNMREELGYFVPLGAHSSGAPPPPGDDWEQCSDYMIKDASYAAGMHNEDSGVEDLNTTFFLHAHLSYSAPDFPEEHFAPSRPGSAPRSPRATLRGAPWTGPPREFFAYVYSGDLPSGAFGWTPSSGLAFSLNYVRPSEGVLGGYGRGFLSRGLLDARDLDEAMDLITSWGQAGGHNYQLFDYVQRRVLNVEAANLGQYAVWELQGPRESSSAAPTENPHLTSEPADSVLYHANEYIHLDINQTASPSSVARESRAAELPVPKSPDDFFSIMGDTVLVNDTYSIYRQGPPDSSYTLHSVMFDIDENIADIYSGNPKQRRVLYSFEVVPTGE